MADLLAKPGFRVWLILAGAAVLSWWLGNDHGLGEGDAVIATVIAIAFVKSWLVGQWFMELRQAPPVLAWAFNAWIIGFGVAVTALYLSG